MHALVSALLMKQRNCTLAMLESRRCSLPSRSAVNSTLTTYNGCTQREETGNPDFNVDRQPVVRAVAVAEPVPVPAVAAPLAPPAAGLPPGAAATPRLLPSSGERPPIPQEQIVLPGEPRT